MVSGGAARRRPLSLGGSAKWADDGGRFWAQATFEAWWFYADYSKVWSALFFNNYGPRTIHPDAGCVSYNWGAPFYLCFNTIQVGPRLTLTPSLWRRNPNQKTPARPRPLPHTQT